MRMLGGRDSAVNREYQIPGPVTSARAYLSPLAGSAASSHVGLARAAAYEHHKVQELFSFMRFVNARNNEVPLDQAMVGARDVCFPFRSVNVPLCCIVLLFLLSAA